MSTISNAFNNWLQRWQSVSVMRQASPSICEMLPPATKDKVVDISEASARWEGIWKPEKIREKGAPITQDYTLGEVKTGTRTRVAIPRPPGTIGTMHTHPFGSPFPSQYDTIDAMDKDDKLMCIGATGKPGTRIQCFTPNKPRYSDIQYRFRLLADDINDFNKRFMLKYKPRTNIKAFLEFIGSPAYIQKVQQTTPDELRKEAEKAERSVKIAEESIRIADSKAVDAENAMRAAQVALSKARTPEEIRLAEIDLREKENELNRAMAKTQIERRLARDARVAADRAKFAVEKLALGKEQATAESREAKEYLREGANLAQRRHILINEIESEMRRLRYPKEWTIFSRGEYIPYFEAYPNMFNKCRIIWEGFDEELPYEL